MALATSTARTRVDDTLLQALPSRLTRRDRYLLRLLYEHDVLTTTHVCDVGFATRRRTTYRLAQLYGLRLIDRVRPLVARGSGEHHWVLDEAGAVVVAAECGLTRRELGWRREDALALASGGQRLEHLVGVNGFFVGLLKTSRRQPGARLSVWWSERRCAAEWGDLVRPDGYGVWTEAGNTVAFALEYDRGTERPADQSRHAMLGEVRYLFLPRSDAGQLPLAGCETTSVFEQFGMRIGSLLPFGEGALVDVLP